MYEYGVEMDLSQMSKNNPNAMAKTIDEIASEGWRLVSTTSVRNPNASYVYLFFERERQGT